MTDVTEAAPMADTAAAREATLKAEADALFAKLEAEGELVKDQYIRARIPTALQAYYDEVHQPPLPEEPTSEVANPNPEVVSNAKP